MNTDRYSHCNGISLFDNHTAFSLFLETHNLFISSIRRITTSPVNVIASLIYNHLPSLQERNEKKVDDFSGDVMGYDKYLHLPAAVEVMNSEEGKTLLAQWFLPESAMQKFLQLENITGGVPRDTNKSVYQRLIHLLEKNKALKLIEDPDEHNAGINSSEQISREDVLLKFILEFIKPQYLTQEMVGVGVRYALLHTISWIYPPLGAAIKFIDGINLVRPLCQDITMDKYWLARQKRSEKMSEHFEKLKHRGENNKPPQQQPASPVQTPSDSPIALATSASPGTAVNAPLLMAGVTSATLLSQVPQPGRSIAPIAGALTLVGGGLMLAYQNLFASGANNNLEYDELLFPDEDRGDQQHVAYGYRPSSLALQINETINSTCYDVVGKVRNLLHSDKSGIRLADEFSQYIFDENGDLRLKNAEKLITTWNITEHTHHDRNQMNELLATIFSMLLTPPGSKRMMNLVNLVDVVNMKVSKIWRDNARGMGNDTIGMAIQALHSYSLRVLVKSLQTTESEKLERIIRFLIGFPAPDFIQFQNHGLSDELVISKRANDYWIEMGVEYPKNKYITFGEFEAALRRGEMMTFKLARIKVYLGDSNNITMAQKYAKYDRVINKPYQEYHEADINLERTIPVSARDIARAKYETIGVDIDKVMDFDRASFKVHREHRRKPEYPIIIECKDLFCVLMSFPDGIKVLYQLMPNSVPGPLRKYPYEGKTVFTLKPHPVRAEIKEDYEKASMAFEEEHLTHYLNATTKSFDIASDDVKKFFYDPEVDLFLVEGHSQRFHMMNYAFIHTSAKVNPEVLSRAAFNQRPKTESGVIFGGENRRTGERKYFLLNPEIARKGQVFPIIPLPINATKDIQTLPEIILNQHYYFKDGKGYWGRCEHAEKPALGWTDNAAKVVEFYSGWTRYGLSELCKFMTPMWHIVPWFEEKKLGPAKVAIPFIIQKAVENRRGFLAWQKKQVDESMLTRGEREEEIGTLGIIAENLPLKSCFDSVNNLLLTSEDVTITPTLQDLIKLFSCGAELLLPRAVIKTFRGIGSVISKINLQKLTILARKTALEKKYKLAQTLPHTSKQQMSTLIESQIKTEISELNAAKRLLEKLEHERFVKYIDALGIPSTFIYPWSNLKPFGSNLVNLAETLKGFPGIVAMFKNKLNDFYQQHKFHPFSRWIAPQGNQTDNIENYIFPLPPREEIPCYNDKLKQTNITLNIFDIHYKDPGLYKELFFTELMSGQIEQVINVASKGGWTIAPNYDSIAIFSFRSFTLEVRKIIMQVLDLGGYYNLNPNRTDIDANFFYQHLKDNINKEQPDPIPNLILTPEQNLLLAQAMRALKDIMTSNILAFERNYRFVLQYIILSHSQETLTALTRTATKKRVTKMILSDVFYYLHRFGLDAKRNSALEQYQAEVMDFLSEHIRRKVEENPAAITLFCESLTAFDKNTNEYLRQHPDAEIPSVAEYITDALQVKNRLAILYDKYARVESTASVLDDYLIDDWSGVDAQTAWLARMMEFLTPEMRYQNLTLFLADATKIVMAEWKKLLSNTDSPHEIKIMHDDEMRYEFIEIVQKAFTESCRIHKNQLFCQYYTMDYGSFTILKHDFISERKPRQLSRRQLGRGHPDMPLPPIDHREIRDEFIVPFKLVETWQVVNDSAIYQQELNKVVSKFIWSSSLPFHERLNGYALTELDASTVYKHDVVAMINHIISENGMLVDYQLRVLQRYLPAGTVMDAGRVLQLLSDIFQLQHPTLPPLYQQVIFYLQTALAGADATLSTLSDGSFVREQIDAAIRQYETLLETEHGATLDAIRRFMRAAIHQQLAFTRHLSEVDPAMIELPAGEGLGQQLCLGAIIADGLRWENVVHGDLVRLATLMMRDAGIVPVNAISQLALFNMPGKHHAEDALATLAYSIEQGAKTLAPLVACINDNQHLMASLWELTFENATPGELELLRELLDTTIQDQQALLTLALPQHQEQQFRAARTRGELQFTWYLAREANSSGEFTLAGLGFDIVNQPRGVIFPLGLPVPESGTFLQTPARITNKTLTAICFDEGKVAKMCFKRKTLTPKSQVNQENFSVITMLTLWMKNKSQGFLDQLATAKNATDFNTIKDRFDLWLTQYFAFYRDSSTLDDQLNAERIIQLTAEADVKKWQTGQHPKPADMSAGNFIEQTVRGLMSSYTDFPDNAAMLRTHYPVDNTLLPDALPSSGFAGAWWDPMSYCCYLGFINGEEYQLFASLVDKRATLFPVTDKPVHASIWRSLSLVNELQQNLTDLRSGAVSTTEFFDQLVPDAWRKKYDQTQERWQLIPVAAASALIDQGVMTPISYLQKTAGINSTRIKLTPYILQYHSGDFIFIHGKNNYQEISYSVLDPSGQLQPLPLGMTEWPRTVTAVAEKTAGQQFRATVDLFLAAEERKAAPDFLPLLNEQQQKNISLALLNGHKVSAEYFQQLSNMTADIPFQLKTDAGDLIEVEGHLRSEGTSLALILQEYMKQNIVISSAVWDIFSWRKMDLYDSSVCHNVLADLRKRQIVFHTLALYLKHGKYLRLFPQDGSLDWVEKGSHIIPRIIAAIEWFKSHRKRLASSTEGVKRLHKNCLAENNFFSRYGAHPHWTPDTFLQTWEFEVDHRPAPINIAAWQTGFDKLRQLTSGLPAANKLLDSFLGLSNENWQQPAMRNATRFFQQQLNRTCEYWQQPHDANDIIIIRPITSSLGLPLAATKRKQPTNLILTAQIGSISGKHQAPPFMLSPEVAEDVLLENVRLTHNITTEARLAGIGSHPRKAKDFVAWTQHRLAGPIFMSELSSPAFLLRLQHRIRQVMATEAGVWSEAERAFYMSDTTQRFLKIHDFMTEEASRRLAFFQALYASEMLIVRLIMPDAEMVFGMLCGLSPQPDEDVTYAWVCLKDTHENIPTDAHLPTLHLVGV